MVTLGFLLAQEVQVGAFLGWRLFSALNTSILFTILLVGPVVTADCIAQEKREGTLGLLFLAPLSARDIVVSKLAVNAVRAFTLLLAALPMMVLPVVFGGLPALLVMLAMAQHLTALCIALSAGILASTLQREFIAAAVWAVLYSLGWAILFMIALKIARALAFQAMGLGPVILNLTPLLVLTGGLIIVERTVQFSSRTLKERWEREGSDFKPPGWVRFFSDSEMWRALFTWDTRRARSAHPIAWLQEYSWTARLAKWGWCALALVGEVVVLVAITVAGRDQGYHFLLAGTVVMGMALAGANSFRTERLSGAMELLLVTPLTPLQLITGRLWGIWVHFFPAVAIIAFLWLGTGPLTKGHPEEAWGLVSSYLFVPMVGLYVSMLPWNVLVAWAVIFLAGVVIPFWGVDMIGDWVREPSPAERVGAVVMVQAAVGIISIWLLHRKLRTRSFQF